MTWLAPLVRHLALARGKVMLSVLDGRGARLREFIRTIAATAPELLVCTELDELLVAPAGATVVLNLRPELASWLNVNRPIFSQRAWRLVLWVDVAHNLAVRSQAPDFMDWVSRVVLCPEGCHEFMVASLAAHVIEPGIIWRGEGLDGVLRTWPPGCTARAISLRQTYRRLLAQIQRYPGEIFIAHDLTSTAAGTRLRWALAEARHTGLCIVPEGEHTVIGYRTLDNTVLPWDQAARLLRSAGAPHPGNLAALLDLEAVAVQLACDLAPRAGWGELNRIINEADDPGAALGRLALEHGLFTREDVEDRQTPSCLSRGAPASTPSEEIGRFHAAVTHALERADKAPDLATLYTATRGTGIDATLTEWWLPTCERSAPRPGVVLAWASAPPGPIDLPRRVLPWTDVDLLVEASIRSRGASPPAGIWAAHLKRHDPAEVWCADPVTLTRARAQQATDGLHFALQLLQRGVSPDGLLRSLPAIPYENVDLKFAIASQLVLQQPQMAIDWLTSNLPSDFQWDERFEQVRDAAWARGADFGVDAHYYGNFGEPAGLTELFRTVFQAREIDGFMRAHFGVSGQARIPQALDWLRTHGRLREALAFIVAARPDLRPRCQRLAARLSLDPLHR